LFSVFVVVLWSVLVVLLLFLLLWTGCAVL
jgi:hypothetical protein